MTTEIEVKEVIKKQRKKKTLSDIDLEIENIKKRANELTEKKLKVSQNLIIKYFLPLLENSDILLKLEDNINNKEFSEKLVEQIKRLEIFR